MLASLQDELDSAPSPVARGPQQPLCSPTPRTGTSSSCVSRSPTTTQPPCVPIAPAAPTATRSLSVSSIYTSLPIRSQNATRRLSVPSTKSKRRSRFLFQSGKMNATGTKPPQQCVATQQVAYHRPMSSTTQTRSSTSSIATPPLSPASIQSSFSGSQGSVDSFSSSFDQQRASLSRSGVSAYLPTSSLPTPALSPTSVDPRFSFSENDLYNALLNIKGETDISNPFADNTVSTWLTAPALPLTPLPSDEYMDQLLEFHLAELVGDNTCSAY